MTAVIHALYAYSDWNEYIMVMLCATLAAYFISETTEWALTEYNTGAYIISYQRILTLSHQL